MAKIDPVQIVLAVVDPEYSRNIDISIIKRDKHLFKSALKTAERNGLYYFFMVRLKEQDLTLPFDDDKRWQEETRKVIELQNTIKLLNKITEDYGINYILIKSCNPIPHLPRDIDILVHKEDKPQLMATFGKYGLINEQPSKVQALVKKKGLLRIDIYTDICYFSVKFIDVDFLWSSIVTDGVFGIKYPNLNKEANFILYLIHSLFGHRSMSLLDFLYLKDLRCQVNLDTCRVEAERNGWGRAFDLYLREFDSIYQRIYLRKEVLPFPYVYSTKFVLQCASEIEGLHLVGFKKTGFYISLGLDKLRAMQKGTSLYRLLRSFEPTRLLLNKIITIFRVMRGDKTA